MALDIPISLFLIYLLITFIAVPFQYFYIKSLKELERERKEKGLSQEEIYDKMSFETQQLHLNAQGNPLFLMANLIASLLYRLKHGKNV